MRRLRGNEAALAARAIAANVAACLDGWAVDETVDPERECAELVAPDGARLLVRVSPWRNEGRVVFQGQWPRFGDGRYHHHGPHPQVTCDLGRGTGEFVKAVRRRLLPVYGPAYARALAYVRREDERAAEARLVAAHIAHAAGAGVRDAKYQRQPNEVHLENVPEAVCRLVVKPAYGSDETVREVRVDFEVHGLDPETAAEVLEVIRRAEERQAAPRAPARVEVDADDPRTAVEAAEHEEPEQTLAPQLRLAAQTR